MALEEASVSSATSPPDPLIFACNKIGQS